MPDQPKSTQDALIHHINSLHLLTLELDSNTEEDEITNINDHITELTTLLEQRYLVPRQLIPRCLIYSPPDLEQIPPANFKQIF